MPLNVSVTSHTQNNVDCDTEHIQPNNNINNNNYSTSPQSSYNSSYGSNSGKNLINSSNASITSLVPGGVVTTQNISTVIKPKSNNNSLQFVKIQTPELSKTAVEQIRIAEETKISKSKIKEVEEEWQNNLLNWKSKRRQQFSHTVEHEPNNHFDNGDNGGGRKIKTFAEMIEQRAKSGNRLGFHLQRYIGSDDNEEETTQVSRQDTENGSSLNRDIKESDNGQDYRDESEQAKTRADSDYEAHSSTSSGYNQLDSKSPSSPEIHSSEPLQASKPEFRNLDCDNTQDITNNNNNNNINFSHDEKDHSISLVDNLESVQLNSTFRNNLVQPPNSNQTNLRRTLLLDLDIKNNEMSAERSEDESENSAYEEEEEEEQKHLQRIAFEAKLKAFERLTIPSTPSSKPKPARSIKAPESTPQSPWLDNSANIDERQKMTKEKPILNENSKFIKPIMKDDSLQRTLSNIASTTEYDRGSLPLPPPPIVIDTQESKFSPKTPYIESSQVIDDNSNSTVHGGFNGHMDMVQKPHSIATQQSIPESIKNLPPPPPPNQRKSIRDEKDRTVLSVSGKKRCSSCKEELGRGAAAFVVESLSLVYHTNCFRCSVCHVNLSNGFRGVDVRVHAGALHCQNCYSRDGLNFSRV